MDRVIPFVEESITSDKPFLATVWFHAPHDPVVAGPEYLKRYPNLEDKQQHLYGCITAMDEQIGRLRSLLRDRKVDQNTIMFFCSDNGPADAAARKKIASAGPFRGHKHQMWEGGIRVPSLMEWPGHLRPNSVCSVQASTNDYLPTILDLTGLPPVKNHPLDGISLKPVLKGELAKRPKPLAFGYQRLYKGIELYALIDGPFKICIPDKGTKMRLYDLESDPQETTDISTNNPIVFSQLKDALDEARISWQASNEGKDYVN